MEKIDHIGIAVKDLDEALKFYEQVLGLKVRDWMNAGATRGAFLRVGEVDLEPLESKDPNSLIGRHLEQKGEGIHHIAFQVKDIVGTLAELKKKGVALLDEKPRPGGGGAQIAFLDPKSAYGVLIELVEPAKK